MKHRYTGEDELSHVLDDVFADDELLDALGRGETSNHSADPVIGALAGARASVAIDDEAPADFLAELEAAGLADFSADDTPATDGEVVSLAAARERKRRPRVNPWLSGIVGAAAATVALAGGGAAIYSAAPGSHLWGLNNSLFGNHAAVVELASTLEQAGDKQHAGDVQGALQLLDQAKTMAAELKADAANKPQPVTVPVTVTQQQVVTTTETAPAETLTVTTTVRAATGGTTSTTGTSAEMTTTLPSGMVATTLPPAPGAAPLEPTSLSEVAHPIAQEQGGEPQPAPINAAH